MSDTPTRPDAQIRQAEVESLRIAADAAGYAIGFAFAWDPGFDFREALLRDLSEDHLSIHEGLKRILRAIRADVEAGEHTTIHSICDRLAQDGHLDGVGGKAYLMELAAASAAGSREEFRQYVSTVREVHAKNRLRVWAAS